MTNDSYILELQDITKIFSGVTALNHVNLKVEKGTVHALVGENGAGKSTLMKIILGLYRQDSGKIVFNGNEVNFTNPNNALQSGIAMIHQELSSALDLTVSQNIFLGKEIVNRKSRILDTKKMVEQTNLLLRKLGITDIDPHMPMKKLSVAKQQMCEIAKAISYNAELILMDEPTSAIADQDVNKLFCIIKELVLKKKTIIYVTHKLDEIFAITDSISVFRDGKHIETIATSETNPTEVVHQMVGRELSDLFPKEVVPIGEDVLRIENLTRKDEFKNINFSVRRGEILGVAGLMGAGRSEIMETIFGIRKKTSGTIYLHGKPVDITSPFSAIRNKLAFLTEDRKSSGCFLPLSVSVNTYIASIQRYSHSLFVSQRKAEESVNRIVDQLSVKASSIDQKIRNLSGGNQQKVLVGRWLLTEPEVLIVDEPTRGIDVGAKAEIHRLLVALAKKGTAIIMISSEMPEILAMSDRIMVVSSGKVAGFLEAGKASQEKIMQLCTGIENS